MKNTLIILSFFLCPVAQSQINNPEEIIEKAQQSFDSLQDFSSNYVYSVRSQNLSTPIELRGKIKYKKGKFVISLKDQEIYNDGTTMWIFTQDKDSPEVNIVDSDAEENNISKAFSISNYGGNGRLEGIESINGVTCYKLYMTFQDLNIDYNQGFFWIDTSGFFMQKTLLINRMQVHIFFEFSEVKRNQGLSDNEFVFDTKKYPGVNIYDER